MYWWSLLCLADVWILFTVLSEATVEVLPRLFKIKYESGTLEELLYVDMPREYQNSSGQIVLDYAKAIQESVFEQLRVVRDGQLRIVFSPDLKVAPKRNQLLHFRHLQSFLGIIHWHFLVFVYYVYQICSWEFCARRHEELIPRRLLIPQVNSEKFHFITRKALLFSGWCV